MSLVWQSAPRRNIWQVGCCLGEFVDGCGIALGTASRFVLPKGERIATPVCALARNDMQKTEAWVRLQGRSPAVSRQCPGTARTGGKIMDVIARSAATRQSVLFAVQHSRKQHFGRMRNGLRIRLRCCLLFCTVAGLRIATPRRPKVCHALLRPKARAGQSSPGAHLSAKGAGPSRTGSQ